METDAKRAINDGAKKENRQGQTELAQ